MTLEEVMELCRRIEEICPAFGCHVALTGGYLYKTGERKDIDLVFYRIRQIPEIDVEGLLSLLQIRLGIKKVSGFGWCIKAIYAAQENIDMLFPEDPSGGDYE